MTPMCPVFSLWTPIWEHFLDKKEDIEDDEQEEDGPEEQGEEDDDGEEDSLFDLLETEDEAWWHFFSNIGCVFRCSLFLTIVPSIV